MATLQVKNTVVSAFEADVYGDSVVINALRRLGEYDKDKGYVECAKAMDNINKGHAINTESITPEEVTLLNGLLK